MIEFAAVGLFVGGISRLLRPKHRHLSALVTLSLGLAGSLLGALIANMLGTGPLFELNLAGFLIASLGAALLIALPNMIAAQCTPGR
ncbi:GlsB/YeaQ/YmgE family stress response membrane protein [Arthrobacter sp. TmT3-37]